MNWSWFTLKSNYLQHPNEFFLELSNFDLNILKGSSKLEWLGPFFYEWYETIISLLNEFANPKKIATFFVNNAT